MLTMSLHKRKSREIVSKYTYIYCYEISHDFILLYFYVNLVGHLCGRI